MKKGDRSTLKGAIESRLYEKFCKSLLPINGESSGFDRIVGDRPEIIPLNDPFKVAVGNDLRVKILYDGQPVSPEVAATYDGFSDTPNSYAYLTEPSDAGEANIKLSAFGLWMVRVQYAADVAGPNYDKLIMRKCAGAEQELKHLRFIPPDQRGAFFDKALPLEQFRAIIFILSIRAIALIDIKSLTLP